MARIRRSPLLLVLVLAVVSSGIAAGLAARAATTPSLPSITPERLIASSLRALNADRPVAGQLLAHVDLGLPSLPDEGPRAQGGLASLLDSVNGDHRVRLWSSGDGYRVAELLPGAEISLTVRRTDRTAEAWAWDSRSFSATHLGPMTAPARPAGSPVGMLDPLQVARQGMAAISLTTRITLGPNARVAGRAVYVLRIEPRSAQTLVGRIEVGIDAETRLPLRVAMFARGAGKPALSLGFTSVSFGSVDPAVYRFTPPPGAAVHQIRAPAGFPIPEESADTTGSYQGIGEYVRTFGRGWATVLAYRIPRLPTDAAGVDLRSLLPFSGPLFSAGVAERGDHAWLLVGAVPPSRLAAVEPQLP